MIKDIASAVFGWMRTRLSAAEICWLCLAFSIGIAYIGSTRYVRASEFQSLRLELREMRTEAIEDKVMMFWRLQCKEPDATRRGIYLDSYRDWQQQYARITGTRLTVPPCTDL